MKSHNVHIEDINSKCVPLCFLPSKKLVVYRFGKIIIYDGQCIIRQFKVFDDFKETSIGRSKWLCRLLRLGVRAAIAIGEDKILISKGNYIYEVDLSTERVSKGYFCGEGIRPLIFTKVNNVSGFKDGIYFGGYLGNIEKYPVHIYKRVGVDQWEIVYTFTQGSINHVHTIVSDSYRSCLWVFTGDFDKAAAIWKISENFRKVEYFAGGNQCYRGCVAYSLPEGVLYATDAPFADNYIYLLNPDDCKLTKLFPIHGSCIYGEQWNDRYVFSSTVEGDGRNHTRFQFLFGRKKGVGIKDDYVHLYTGNIVEGFSEIFKLKKDRMPLYTFQFGVFKFPYGENHTDTLYFQPIATSKKDLNLLALK